MTAADERTEDFLAHFGVKGMKWGVRRKRETSGGDSGGSKAAPKEKTQRTPEQIAARKARNKKIAIGVGVGVAVVGAAAATYVLKKHGNERLANVAQAARNAAANKVRSAVSKKVNDSISNKAQQRLAPNDPSPADLRYQLGLRAQVQAMNKVRNQELTRDTWVNSAQLSQTQRQNDAEFQNTLETLQRAGR